MWVVRLLDLESKYPEVRRGITQPGSSWKSVISSDSRLSDKGKRSVNPNLNCLYPRMEKTEIANRPSNNQEEISPHWTEGTPVDERRLVYIPVVVDSQVGVGQVRVEGIWPSAKE